MLKGKPKTDKKLVWTSDCEAVFNKTKSILSQASLLVYPVINAPTSLMVHASDVAIGGVLQICLNGIWSPIAFFSRRLTPAQRKYSAFDRELLAMYLTVQHFLYFIEEKKFTIFTDHKPLIRAFSSSKSQTIPRRVRHMGYISEFSTDICYVQGSENFVADTLSRVEINGRETLQDGINYAQIALDQRTDSDLNQLLKNPTDTGLRLSEYPVPHSNYMLWCDTSTSMIRPVIPSSWRKIIFNKLHGISHPGIKGTSKLISRRFVWTGMRKDISKWVRECLSCKQCKIHRHTISPLEKI